MPRYPCPPWRMTSTRNGREHFSSSENDSYEDERDTQHTRSPERRRRTFTKPATEEQRQQDMILEKPTGSSRTGPSPHLHDDLPQTPKPGPISKPRVPILSIDEIVRRHSPAMSNAEAAARANARKEIILSSPRADTCSNKSTPTSSASSPSSRRRPNSQPSVPIRTSSSAGVRDGLIPPRTTSMTREHHVRQSLSFESTRIGTNRLGHVRVRQVLVDQPDKGSTRSGSSSTPWSAKRVSLRSDILVTSSPALPTRCNPSVPRSPDPEFNQDHAMAVYLSSPHLNRSLDLPRPFPERPLHVSFAEIGSPTGRPVVLFLGLGCVRYLIALFDDVARALGLRLICIDRWGLGKTDNVPQERRSELEWAQVVERVLSEIGVDRFQLVAHSAGAPYACATALQLRDRVIGRMHLLAPWVSTDSDNSKCPGRIVSKADGM